MVIFLCIIFALKVIPFLSSPRSSIPIISLKLKNLGYKPIFKNIKTDDVTREIFKNIKKNHSIKLICELGGLRTVLMVCDNR